MGSFHRWFTLLKLTVFSSIGVFLFFVPVTIQGNKTIPLDHITSFLTTTMRPVAVTLLITMMFYGGLSPFFTGQFRLSTKLKYLSSNLFSVFKLIGLILSILYLSNLASAWMMEPSLLPFLFNRVVLTVGILIPLGSLALSFLLGFGFLELVGVMMEKIMRPLFRTPGYSAIDAVTSFVGSYSISLLITNKMYQMGRYSIRDAVITATGFSTVSATFMVVVAKTLGLMEHWNLFFWSTFFITFLVTAFTAHLPPITLMDNTLDKQFDAHLSGNRLQYAIDKGIEHYTHREPIGKLLLNNFKEGVRMSSIVTPSILSVGFIGLCIAKYTPFFEWIGYILKPVLIIAGFIMDSPDISVTSGAFAASLVDMFVPAVLLKDEPDLGLRFITAVTSISCVLFFSGCIPCILATSIPVKIRDLLIIWLIRVILSIFFSSILAKFLIQTNLLF